MKLGQTGYTLSTSLNNSKCVATLVNGYGAYANTSEYVDGSGNSYIVGAIGGPTIQLVEARVKAINSSAYLNITFNDSGVGYYINDSTEVYWSGAGIPELAWLASPAGRGVGYICAAREGYIGNEGWNNGCAIYPVVCLKSSIPATWNGSSWDLN